MYVKGGNRSIKMIRCRRPDCLWNLWNKKELYGECQRDEILIDKVKIFGGSEEIQWTCRSFSDIKISGHTDWGRLQKTDGTVFGGHISDEDSEKMYHDARVSKSYRTHTRQG